MDDKTIKFIEKCKKKYGEKFDYSHVIYNGSHENVEIGCKEHGFFNVSATNFLQRGACPLCSKKPNMENLRNEFIKKAIEKYGDKYSYNNVVYNGCYNIVTVTCKKHGDFFVKPDKFLQGQECPLCEKEKQQGTIYVLSKENV